MKLNGPPIKFVVSFIFILFLPFAKVQKLDSQKNKQVIVGSIYEFYADRLQKFNDALQELNHKFTNGNHNGKRSVVNNLLYEEFKRRLDKFSNEMSLNPIVFKENSDEPLVDKDEKRATNKDNVCLHEEYRKKLENVYDKFPLNEENFFENHSQEFEEADKAHKELVKEKTSNIGKFGETPCPLDDDKNYPYEKSLNFRRYRQLNQQNKKNDNNLGMHDFTKTYIIKQPNNVIGRDKIDSELPFPYKYLQNNERLYLNEQNTKNTLECFVDDKEMNNNYEEDGMKFKNTPFAENFIAGIQPDKSEENRFHQTKLLEGLAKKLKMSTIDLSKKLTTITDLNTLSVKDDPELTAILREYIGNTVMTGIKTRLPKSPPFRDSFAALGISKKPPQKQQCHPTCDDEKKKVKDEDGNTMQTVSGLLDKVLENLEKVKKNKNKLNKLKNKSKKIEGGPCKIAGSWNSYVLGLKLNICFNNKYEQKREAASCNTKEKQLNIKADECNPPKEHEIISADWTFTGSALKTIGGPFYIYSQKPNSNVLATFVGFCRICGGTDTIFGSWTFLFPSKDCQDISTSIENKRDIFRRTNSVTQKIVLQNEFLKP